jgi:Methane oxygenase PmoA
MNRFTSPLFPRAVLIFAVVASGALPGHAQVDLKAVGDDHIAITVNGQPFSDFYFGNTFPKPFLAPLRAATGQIVTRKFPMEKVAGESNDHQHHRGLFIGYGEISGINFWENEFDYQTRPNKGKIVTLHVDPPKSGKKSGSISASFDWRNPNGTSMIEEHRTMTFYAEREERMIDIDFTLTAKVNVSFADTKEGFFAIRLADSMIEKNGGLMTNAAGAQTEEKVWGKKSDWVDYDGTVEGQKIGIVIFDHPANNNHPTRWHSRAYGLFAANPFGLKDFDKNAEGKGGLDLPAGEALRFRYRVIIHRGDIPKKKIAEWYADYKKKVK